MKQDYQVILKTPEEIQIMKSLGGILAEIVKNLYELADIGKTPQDLEQRATELCEMYNVNPSCKGYMGYPAATCIGINNQSVHNIPSAEVLKSGDILTIDMVIDQNGWFVDHAVTKMIGNVDARGKKLVQNTKNAMENAIAEVKVGNTIGDLGEAMEGTVKPLGFSVLRNYVGHGIGRSIHEEPKIPCYGKAKTGTMLKEGMVFTIEPMVSEFSPEIVIGDDGWSTNLKNGGRFAMFEHTVALTTSGVQILTKKE